MKPLVVRFQAFGPYKNEQVIDFKQLSKQGLFLICGETGSGKTTILDAITFALYGKSSGGMRDQLEFMRCKQSEWGTDTYVCYDFELQGNVYRFERKLECKKVKLSASQNVYLKNEDGVFAPIFENCKEKDMNAKAKELLGLDYDQFRQVIILPQGQFEKLLTSNSDEKEKILVSIFGVNKWQKIANRLYDMAAEKRNTLLKVKEEMELRLKDEECKNLEEFANQIEVLKQSIQLEEEKFIAADFEGQKKKAEQELELGKQYQELRELEQRLAALKAQKELYEEKQVQLKLAEEAEGLRIHMNALEESKKNFQKREKDLEELGKLIPIAKQKVAEAEVELAHHMENQEKIDKWQEETVRLEERKPYYQSISEKEKAVKDVKKRYEDLVKIFTKCEDDVKRAGLKLQQISKDYKDIRDAYAMLSDAFLSGITGNLAAKLEANAPCPVCGSTEHPQKAKLPERVVSEAEVKTKETEMHRKFSEIEASQAAYQKAQTAKEEQERLMSACDSQLQVLVSELETAKKNLIKGVDSMEVLEKAIEDRKRLVKAFQQKQAKLEQELLAKKNALAGSEAKWNVALEEKAVSEKDVETAKEVWITALKKTGFVDLEHVQRSLLAQDKMTAMREAYANYQAQMRHLDSEIAVKAKELEGKEEPDMTVCRAKLNEIMAAKEQYISEMTKQKLALSQKEEKHKKIKAMSAEYEKSWFQVETDWALAKNLRGDTGIGLQRYVLGVMFSSVIAAANKMLEKVHGGRYRLFRSDEKSQGTNKKGLELKVFDSFSKEGDEGRSVKTLSGGEKFLVSLALSIGMSTIAQRSGTHLDAMFVDEGFGSLDQNSIEDALGVLASIQKANGTVGIISHVQVLQDNIPTKLEIKKTKNGSHIVMNVG